MADNKWGKLGITPEESIEAADRHIVEYDENTGDTIEVDINLCWMNYLDAIAKALVEIRDELRKMNEKGDK